MKPRINLGPVPCTRCDSSWQTADEAETCRRIDEMRERVKLIMAVPLTKVRRVSKN